MTTKTTDSNIEIEIEEFTTQNKCDYGIAPENQTNWINKITKFKNRNPICIVSNWSYWDIKYSKEEISALKEGGFLPAALFSGSIIILHLTLSNWRK